MASPDGLRKRMALALSEIFVVSANDIGSSWPHHMMAQYWDTLVAGVTGNFRSLLEDITLNPAMGYYLNTKGNQKENAQGRQPDENYAREVMQLMTIGLYQLDAKGNVKLAPTAAAGQLHAGRRHQPGARLHRLRPGHPPPPSGTASRRRARPHHREQRLDPRRWRSPSTHSMLEASFLGATVPASTEGTAALKTALDTLFNHPNVGPFIGKQLIQRLVTSNPSPDYVGACRGGVRRTTAPACAAT